MTIIDYDDKKSIPYRYCKIETAVRLFKPSHRIISETKLGTRFGRWFLFVGSNGSYNLCIAPNIFGVMFAFWAKWSWR